MIKISVKLNLFSLFSSKIFLTFFFRKRNRQTDYTCCFYHCYIPSKQKQTIHRESALGLPYTDADLVVIKKGGEGSRVLDLLWSETKTLFHVMKQVLNSL